MPVHTWADNDVPTASDLNTNYRDQVISTVTSATRPSGTEGQFIYETDTDLVQGYNGGWVQFGGLGAWTSYTPTLSQSGTVTKTVTYAKYIKIGRLVIVNVYLAITGTGTANNPINVQLPVNASQSSIWVPSSAIIYDSSVTTVYPGTVAIVSATAVQFTDTSQATTVNLYQGQTGVAFSAALASGDVVSFGLTYESV